MHGIEDVYIHEGQSMRMCFKILPVQHYSHPGAFQWHKELLSIVVLNNASIHHLDRIQYIKTSSDALIYFLPPYSPNLMQLEKAISKLNAFFKLMNKSFYHIISQIINSNGICKCYPMMIVSVTSIMIYFSV